MPLKVTCPDCSKELNATEDLVGKLVACPRCQKQFPVAAGAPAANQSSAFPPGFEPPSPPSPAAVTPPPTPSAAGQSAAPAPSGAAQFIAPAAEPRTAVTPPEPTAGAVSASAFPPGANASPPASASLASRQPPPPPSSVTPPASVESAKAQRRDMSRGSGSRSVQAATFVTAAPVQTNVALGADGKLPDLQLTEAKRKDDQAAEQPRSPLLVIAALTVSVGMSVLMLVVDFDTAASPTRSKVQYRQDIEEHYTQPAFKGGELESYQKNLRAALQAHNRGDSRVEKIYLHRVLDMMEAEDVSPTRGITGRAEGEYPVSDEHLRKTISQLLQD